MHIHLQRTLLLATSWVLFMPAPAMAGTVSVAGTVAVPASAPVSETAGTVVPTYRLAPVYPAEAQYRHIEGCVAVQFNINAEGHPTDLSVWSHYPSGIFDEAAIQTVANWRFRVTDTEGQPAVAKDVMQDIIFQIRRSRLRWDTLDWICSQPPPRTLIASAASASASQTILVSPHGERTDLVTLPLPAGQTLRDGWVKVGFCIDGNGRVTRPEIKDSSPRGLYDQAAVAALSTWKFSGREVGSKATTVCGLSYEVPVIARSTLAKGPAAIGQMPTAIAVRDLGGVRRLWTFSGSKVVVRFCVEKDGSVSNAEVVESKIGTALGPAALNVIRSWQFLPKEVGGKPVRACGIGQTIQFRVDRNLLFADPRALLQNEEWTGS